jgi:hypothetical protein
MKSYQKFLVVGVLSMLPMMANISNQASAQVVSNSNQPHVTATQGAENIFGGAALGAVVSRIFGNSGRTGAWVGAVAGGVKTVYDNYKLSAEAKAAQTQQISQNNTQAPQVNTNNYQPQPNTNTPSQVQTNFLKMAPGVNGIDYKANISNLSSGAIEIQTKTIGDMLYALNSLTPKTSVYITPEEYKILTQQKEQSYSAHVVPAMNLPSQYLSIVDHLAKHSDIGIVQTNDGSFVIGTKYQTQNLSELPNLSTSSVMQEISIRNVNQGQSISQPEQFPSSPIAQTPQNIPQVQQNIGNVRANANANNSNPYNTNPQGGLAAKYH